MASTLHGPDERDVEEWILSIIDQLRQRKARPDLERICHFVERKHGLSRKETETRLEKLVDSGAVIKVMYKRGTSYRNARNSKTKKRTYVSNVLNSSIASQRINQAINALLDKKRNENEEIESNSNEPKETLMTPKWKEKYGISSSEIELWVEENFGGVLGPYPIHWMLQREVDAENLCVLENGNFLPRDPNDDDIMGLPSDVSSDRPALQKSMSVVAKRGRPPKRKLPMMDRSLSWSEGQRPQELMCAPTLPLGSQNDCDFCQKSAECNKQGLPEELLFCKDCNAKAHPSCMNYSAELAARARKTSWQCIDCKICCLCADPGEADCMLFCDACDLGYHMQCHEPKVMDKPQGKWVCNACVMDGVNVDDIEENTFSSVIDSTVKTDSESCASLRNSERRTSFREEETIPSATNWSISDVVDFLEEKGFKDHAGAFRDQEIDGQSLLLLKRSDVLQGLSLKLGPALKIYNLIMKLQSAGQAAV